MSNISMQFNGFLKSPIKLKVFFAFIFIFFALVITTISFIVNYNYEKSYIANEIHEKAQGAIKNKVNFLKSIIDDKRLNLEAISKNELFKEYLDNRQNKESILPLFQQAISSDTNIMQIRYIDKEGMEQVRLERSEKGESYQVVVKSVLQNKLNRYYFQEALKFTPQSPIWISDIDLNIENGQLQKPYVPTVRLVKAVFNEKKFEGILIINLFMKDALEKIISSSMFEVSLVDRDGDILVGQYEIAGKTVDYSWSRYLLKKIDFSSLFPIYFNDILHSYEFDSEFIHSKRISAEIGLVQDIILVLKIKEQKLNDIKESTIHKILDTLGIVLLISGPIGLLLAYIPSLLATKVLSASKKLDEKTIMFDEYLEAMNINNIISKSDLKGKITYVNKNFCDVTGYTREEVLGRPHSLLRDPEEKKETFKILWLTIQSGKTWKGILRNRKKDGGFYDVDIAIMPIFDTNHHIVEYLAIRHEITELIAQRKNLLSIATKDPLTGVGNRYKGTSKNSCISS